MDNFKNYITLNNIDIDAFYEIMEEYLLNEMLISILNYLEKNNNKMILKEKFLYCNDNASRLLIARTYIRKILSVECTYSQQIYLLEGVYAYMRKSSVRKTNNSFIKKNLFIKQSGKCNICYKDLKESDMELDHKLAFEFVGDELQNNIQLLCKECNRRKGINQDYSIKKFLLR